MSAGLEKGRCGMSGTMLLESVRGGVRPFVEWIERSRSPSPEETEGVLKNAAVPVFLLEELWGTAKEMMDRGVEHGKLMVVLGDLLKLTESCLRAFADVLARTEAVKLNPAGAVKLQAEVEKLQEMKTSIVRLAEWLSVPPPPIELASLPARGPGRHAAGFISLEEFSTKLRARESN
jgi:hypothetical protein